MLSGLHFRVGLPSWDSPPLRLDNCNGSATAANFPLSNASCSTGLMIDIVDTLSSILRFTYSYHITEEGYGSCNTNLTVCTGLAKMLLEGTIDIAGGFGTPTANRIKFMDFSVPFPSELAGAVFLIRKPDLRIESDVLWKPFSRESWSLLLITVILSWLMLLFVVPKHNGSVSSRLFGVSWRILRIGTQQGDPDADSSTASAKAISLAWIVSSLIWLQFYSASLVSYFTRGTEEPPFSGMPSLIPLIRDGKARMLVSSEQILHGEFAARLALIRSIGGHYEQFAKVTDRSPPEILSSHDEIVKRIETSLDKIYFHYNLRIIAEYVSAKACRVTIVPDPHSPFPLSLGFRKSFPYLEQFNSVIASFTDKTIKSKLKVHTNKLQRNCTESGKDKDGDSKRLALDNLSGVFWLLVGGVVLATTTFLLELKFGWCYRVN